MKKEVYNIAKRKEILHHFEFWYLLTISIIILLIFSCRSIKVQSDLKYTGIITEDKTISIFIPVEALQYFVTRNKLQINNQKYSFAIKEVLPVQIEKGKMYQEIRLEIFQTEKKWLPNSTVSISIFIKEKSLFEICKDSWRREE